MKSKRITLLSLLIALAMILSYVESQIPSPLPIPGVKLGLANIVVIFTLYKSGLKDALIVSLIRVLILSIIFGTVVSLIYSLAGAVLSLLAMVLMLKTNKFTIIGVSIMGGVMHNVGQIIAACWLLEANLLAYYLPYLLICGIGSGIVIGMIGGQTVKRIKA